MGNYFYFPLFFNVVAEPHTVSLFTPLLLKIGIALPESLIPSWDLLAKLEKSSRIKNISWQIVELLFIQPLGAWRDLGGKILINRRWIGHFWDQERRCWAPHGEEPANNLAKIKRLGQTKMFSLHKGKSGLNYCELSWFMLEPLSLEGQQREFPCAAVNATTILPLRDEVCAPRKWSW